MHISKKLIIAALALSINITDQVSAMKKKHKQEYEFFDLFMPKKNKDFLANIYAKSDDALKQELLNLVQKCLVENSSNAPATDEDQYTTMSPYILDAAEFELFSDLKYLDNTYGDSQEFASDEDEYTQDFSSQEESSSSDWNNDLNVEEILEFIATNDVSSLENIENLKPIKQRSSRKTLQPTRHSERRKNKPDRFKPGR